MGDWRDFLSLRDGEYVVDERSVSDGGELGGGLGGGVLALTNKRIVFLKEFGRIFSAKSYAVYRDIPLELVRGIDCMPPKLSISSFTDFPTFRIVIYTGGSKLEFTIVELPSQPYGKFSGEHFKEKVLEQMKNRRQELERKKTPIVIDFSFIKTFIEKGGIVLTTLKCPNCSAPIKMPKNGTETVCDHCGSTIYAQDIFEKLKTLIG